MEDPLQQPLYRQVSCFNMGLHYKDEYSGDYNELLYLRSRYYAAGMGRFLTRDIWSGRYDLPLTLNRWNYALANPIYFTDPTGQSPNCPLGEEQCARQRLFEIVYAEFPNDGVSALVNSFNDSELFNLWGNRAGRTSAKRLEWLLDETRNHSWKPVHFEFDFGDCGFAEEFMDNDLYLKWHLPRSASNQVGHFLSAVDITYNYWNIGFLIGHEQYSDLSDWNQYSYISVSDDDLEHWYKAVEYDIQGNSSARDNELWKILHFDPAIAPDVDPSYVDPSRQGNSLQDLRLSLRGYRFAGWVRQNANLYPNAAGEWLRIHLGSN